MSPALSRTAFVLLLGAAVLFPCAVGAGEYGDIAFVRKTAGMDDVPPAVFAHWIHRMQYKCAVCHDDLFKMSTGATITMDQIQAGKSCGACHNGKTAFASSFLTCTRCHTK